MDPEGKIKLYYVSNVTKFHIFDILSSCSHFSGSSAFIFSVLIKKPGARTKGKLRVGGVTLPYKGPRKRK